MAPRSNRGKSTPKSGREPRRAELAKARECAGLTQSQAADLIYTSPRNWQNWEQGSDGRAMPASAFELFLLKTGQFAFDALLVVPDTELPARLQLRLNNGAVVELSLPPSTLASLSCGLSPQIPLRAVK